MHKGLQALVAAASVVMAAALCVIGYQIGARQPQAPLTTPYQAVALTNGQVFFGRIDRLGEDYLVLRDAFYIQSRQNPETKQVANILVKRGGEAHGPEYMVLNARHVVQIEPVGEASQIGMLIKEQQKEPATAR